MNKTEFIKQLRETAKVLEPLTQSTLPGTRFWDGTSYVKSEANAKVPDPYALAWWMALRSIAGLMEAQDSPISSQQAAYLKSMLFSGMGSLNDLSFRNADAINSRLNEKRGDLYTSFTV
jgi:hypothetical protein